VPELATAAAIGKRAPTVVGGKVIVLGPQDHPASLPSGRPRPPQVPSPSLRACLSPAAFTMADLRVHDDRSSLPRRPDLRVHDGQKFAPSHLLVRTELRRPDIWSAMTGGRMQFQPQGVNDLENCVEARTALAGKRLVKAFAG